MIRFDFEFACKIRAEPLLPCAVADLDINFDPLYHTPALPIFSMIWLLSYCVLSDVPPHFSTPLHAITCSVYSLHSLPISPLEAL